MLGGAGGMNISTDDQVIGGQTSWRWSKQDGGCKGVGTITEMYASPSLFKAGDYDCDINDNNEFYDDNGNPRINNHNNRNNKNKNRSALLEYTHNPHNVKRFKKSRKNRKYKRGMN